MASLFTCASLCIITVCVYMTVSGQRPEEKETFYDGHVNKMNKEQNLEDTRPGNILPKKLSRRSVLNVRTRREVRTLVGGLRANAEKLENLTSGVEFLVQSTKAEQVGNTDVIDRLETIHTTVIDRLETINKGIMKRIEEMNPLFVSMFVMLADVALSTSPRIAKHRETISDIANYFRANMTTQNDRNTFDKNMLSVYDWYYNKTSCVHIRDFGLIRSDVYAVRIPNTDKLLNVFCDQKTDGGGWLVIQRRQDGSEDFYRGWSDYQKGFGDISGEFWLGNDNLYLLTRNNQELRVDLTDFEGNTAYAKYSSFAVGSASENYKLTVDGYSGTAGDAMTYHNGMEFSTRDRDNDVDSSKSCAERYKGSWWYNSCHHVNLNGIYYNNAKHDNTGIRWHQFKSDITLKAVEMKIRPRE